MKNLGPLLLVAAFVFLFGCTPKQQSLYFDQHGKAVTQEKQRRIFDRNRGRFISATISEGDTIKYQLVPRKESGKLRAEDNRQIAEYLGIRSKGNGYNYW